MTILEEIAKHEEDAIHAIRTLGVIGGSHSHPDKEIAGANAALERIKAVFDLVTALDEDDEDQEDEDVG